MFFGSDFSPSTTPENEMYALDFVNDLASGDSISTATWACTNAVDSQVIDPSPSSRFVSGPFISGTVVSGRFSGFLAGVKYTLTATIVTALGNTEVGFAHVTGEAVF